MAGESEVKQEAQESAPPKKKSKKLLLIISIVAVLLLGGGAVAYFIFFRSAPPATDTTDAGDEGKAGDSADAGAGDAGADGTTPVEADESVIVSLDHFIVNVASDIGDTRYLKVEIKLELESSAMEKEVENRTPKIKDSIVTILTNKSVADISDVNGKLRLKEEIKARLNAFLKSGKIKEVYFTDFIIQ